MQKAQDNLTAKKAKEIDEQLDKYYTSAMKKTISSFEATYDKILAQQAEGKQITPALLYKLDTYWQMQANMAKELQKLGNKQMVLFSKQFEDEFIDIYESLAIEGHPSFRTADRKMANQMINTIWTADGKAWSDRIWDNLNHLQETLNEELIHCVVAGKKTSDLKKLLQERFGVSYNRADTLARTEMAHIQTQAAQQRYIDAGITEMEVWASPDERRCEICGKLHKMRYPVNSKAPIPAHPRCRCTIIPVVE